MPDVSLNGIEFKIKGSSSEASASVQNLINKVNELRTSLNGVKSIKQTASALKSVGNAAKKASSPLKTFAASLKRIAFYRILRSILKSITQAFQEGLKNAYQFSKATGDGAGLAGALDTLATKSMTMKNQLGAAFGGLLTAITPIVVKIIQLVTKLAEAISRLFAILGGNGHYLKAKEVWTDWGEAAEGAGGAAKKALEYLAPFDELNVLPDPKSGGGGGASTDWGDMFEYASTEEFEDSFFGQMMFNMQDVIFNWDDLTPEQIAMKAIVGLGGFLGGVAGFMIGGVPGAVVGTIVGVSLALAFNTAVFNNDGVISKSEIASMVAAAASALAGGAIGFVVGGPGGALIGAAIGLGIEFTIEAIGLNAGDNPLLAALLPGATVGQLQGIPLQDQLEIFEAWFKDNFARGIAQAAIDLVNGITNKVTEGVNWLIEKYNNIARVLGWDEIPPIEFKLIPDLDPPVGTFYKRKKAEIERKSQSDPIDFKGRLHGIDLASLPQSERSIDMTGKIKSLKTSLTTPTVSMLGKIVDVIDSIPSGKKTMNATANFTDTKNSIGTPNINTKANITKYDIEGNLKDTNGNMKVNVTANITKTTGNIGGKAMGGAYYGGLWHGISQFAGGGSLFVAGEAGPEIVGHFGGRTEVLNQSQLAATMYAAVANAMRSVSFSVSAPNASNAQTSAESEETMYRAFSRALADSDLGGDMELDGETIYRSVLKRNRQNTRITGVNAMAATV